MSSVVVIPPYGSEQFLTADPLHMRANEVTNNHHEGTRIGEKVTDEPALHTLGKDAKVELRAKELQQLITSLEEEHRVVGEKLQILQRVSQGIVGASDQPEEIQNQKYEEYLETLQGVSHYFRTDLDPHFASEEQELFPLLQEGLPKGPELVHELVREHEQLREQFESFAAQLAVLRYVESEGRPRLLFALMRTCWEIWDRLRNHAEKEDHAIGEYVISRLDQPPTERPNNIARSQ